MINLPRIMGDGQLIRGNPCSPSWTPTTILSSPSILAHLNQPTLIPADAPSGTKSFITCYAPATGAHLATIPSHSAEQISAKIAAAEAAQPAWAETTWAQRRRVMYTILSWLLRDVGAITRVCCRDTGKTSKPRGSEGVRRRAKRGAGLTGG